MGEWEEAVGGGSEIVTKVKGCVHRQGKGIDRKGSEIVTAAADTSINYLTTHDGYNGYRSRLLRYTPQKERSRATRTISS